MIEVYTPNCNQDRFLYSAECVLITHQLCFKVAVWNIKCLISFLKDNSGKLKASLRKLNALKAKIKRVECKKLQRFEKE